VHLGPFWEIRRLSPTTEKIKGINKKKKEWRKEEQKKGKKEFNM